MWQCVRRAQTAVLGEKINVLLAVRAAMGTEGERKSAGKEKREGRATPGWPTRDGRVRGPQRKGEPQRGAAQLQPPSMPGAPTP